MLQRKKYGKKNLFNRITEDQICENKITIFINYYDLGRKIIFVNKELKVKYLISDILYKMKLFFGEMRYKRYSKNQTTKFVIDNPIRSITKNILEEYDLPFKLEYNGKNLIEYFEKKLSEIGLKEGKVINVLFTKDLTNEPTEKIGIVFITQSGTKNYIIINRNATLKDAIKKYAMRNGIYFDSIGKDIIMIYNGRTISKSETLAELEASIFALTITVLEKTNIIGRKMVDFVDVSNGKIKKLEFSKNAPKWREISKGLNIFGICENTKCEVWKKEVVYKTELDEK